MHPWHDLTIGEEFPKIVNFCCEVPMGCRNKYELEKSTGLIRVDRVLPYSIYPANYGFVPQTYAEDFDPLDMLLLSSMRIHPYCISYARPIGVMEMLDGGQVDSKIIAVMPRDPAFEKYNNITELSEYRLREIKSFFQEYKFFEKKEVKVEDFQSADKAREIISACNKRYWDACRDGEIKRK